MLAESLSLGHSIVHNPVHVVTVSDRTFTRVSEYIPHRRLTMSQCWTDRRQRSITRWLNFFVPSALLKFGSISESLSVVSTSGSSYARPLEVVIWAELSPCGGWGCRILRRDRGVRLWVDILPKLSSGLVISVSVVWQLERLLPLSVSDSSESPDQCLLGIEQKWIESHREDYKNADWESIMMKLSR
jgi:hypothetical protein